MTDTSKNIVFNFFEAAKNHPQHIAFRGEDMEYSFDELSKIVAQKAKKISELGIKTGDTVFIAIPIGVEFYSTLLAVFYMGATAVLLDDVKNKSSLKYALKQTNAKIILTTRKLWWLRFFFLPITFWFKCFYLKHTKQELPMSPVLSNDTALVTFTSGTTGKPKAAKRSHEFLNIQLETLVEEMKINSDVNHLSSLPVVLLCNLAVGAQTIFESQNNRYREANLISGSPYFIHQFVEQSAKPKRIFIGGSVIYPALVDYLASELPSSKVSFAYGSTEAEPISLITRKEYKKKLNDLGVPVGRKHEHIEVKIKNKFKHENLTVGEILVRGRHVLKNYLNPEDTRNKWENGWLKTGDLGYFEGDCLFFVGRAKYCWKENNQIRTPLQVEMFCNEIYPNATQLLIDNKATLFYTKKISTELLESIHSTYDFDLQYQVDQFSYDTRHNSRINYEELLSIALK